MTFTKIMAAWDVITRLMQEPNSYKMAYGLTRVKRELEPNVEFFREKEYEIIVLYAEKDANGNVVFGENNTFKVPNEHISEFVAQHEELLAVEVDIEPYKIDDCPQTISGADLEALEGIIEFKEPD